MPILRLAYATQFLIAVLAVFMLWSEVGGQSHLDLMPWYLKLGLGGGAAFAVVKATAASVEKKQAWNGGTLKWFGILLALLLGCGLASYYYHVYGESDEDDQDDTVTSMIVTPISVTVAVECMAGRIPAAAAAQIASLKPYHGLLRDR